MAEYAAEGKSPEVLFFVGCAGSFDQRAQQVTKAFVKILNSANISFGVLGKRRLAQEILLSALATIFYFKCKH